VIIQRQMEHGFVFDYQAADMLHAKLMERQQELEDIVHETFRPLAKIVREVQPRVKIDGTVSSVGLHLLMWKAQTERFITQAHSASLISQSSLSEVDSRLPRDWYVGDTS